MSSGELIADRRRELGLTQGQLADLAATSRERINTYEREQVSPQSDTLERVLASMHSQLTVVSALTFEERRSLAMSTAVAAKLRENPALVMAKGSENIERMRSIGPGEQRWVDVWESVLALGAGPVEALLTSLDQFARDLRQSSPFAGVLSEDERRKVLHGLHR
ncbi:helix-turn-helix domain-containing protein [Acidimicrobiaceae bacterium AH-315-P05]|nr:helix-turn-helix domain-containing protein [Acidimicrobiaceae bacterium AH-315-P05]